VDKINNMKFQTFTTMHSKNMCVWTVVGITGYCSLMF